MKRFVSKYRKKKEERNVQHSNMFCVDREGRLLSESVSEQHPQSPQSADLMKELSVCLQHRRSQQQAAAVQPSNMSHDEQPRSTVNFSARPSHANKPPDNSSDDDDDYIKPQIQSAAPVNGADETGQHEHDDADDDDDGGGGVDGASDCDASGRRRSRPRKTSHNYINVLACRPLKGTHRMF